MLMARCTAPVRGHTRGGGADCPVCGPRYRSYRSSYAPSYIPSYTPSYSSSGSGAGGRSGGGGSSRTAKPSWSGGGSSQYYTAEEVRALTPIRETVEKRAPLPDLRHIFLCHAWDDRQGSAKQLNDLLIEQGVSVWFSENDIGLGEPFLRSIDKGLAKSRIGIVLVTPALLKRLPSGGVADKELSVLLQRDQLVPIIHNTTYDALREVSPMLASRNGLDTAEVSMIDVAAKLAELVTI
jgi:TIR domain